MCIRDRTLSEANIWSITLSPNIREWFGSGKTPVNQLGIDVYKRQHLTVLLLLILKKESLDVYKLVIVVHSLLIQDPIK